MAGGVLVGRFSPHNLIIFMIFVLVQSLRTKWEEDKFMKTVREYKNFAVQSRRI